MRLGHLLCTVVACARCLANGTLRMRDRPPSCYAASVGQTSPYPRAKVEGDNELTELSELSKQNTLAEPGDDEVLRPEAPSLPRGRLRTRPLRLPRLRTRRAVEREEFSALSVADLRRFRDCHARWGGALSVQYPNWLEHGSLAAVATTHLHPRRGSSGGILIRRALPYSYSQCGSTPGVV